MNDNQSETYKKIVINERYRHWGTIFDRKNIKQKDIPPKYIGASFSEMNHDDVKKFLLMNDLEKFEYSFWAEKICSRNALRLGFIIGVIVTIIFAIYT